MKTLTQLIVRSLVDHPEEVIVTETEGNMITILELSVANADIGQVIGRQGRTAQALRTILGSISAKRNKRVIVDIANCSDEVNLLPKIGKTVAHFRHKGCEFVYK